MNKLTQMLLAGGASAASTMIMYDDSRPDSFDPDTNTCSESQL
jgi:hypothetical protein